MDTIPKYLSSTPVPCLEPAFSAFKSIWSDVKQAQVGKGELEALALSVAQLLQTLDAEYRERRLLEAGTMASLDNLSRLLDNISAFAQKVALSSFLKLLFTKNKRNTRMESYHRSIMAFPGSFQISALLSTHAWQTRMDDARVADQRALNDQLLHLENNRQRLMDTLNTHRSSVMAMIVSLQRHISQRSDSKRERQFFSHVLRHLTTSSGLRVELQDWMITSYDVEFGPRIGSGGFGQVFLGTCNNTQVALKVLVTDAGTMLNSTGIRQEIETWSMLRHTHILQFLGANEFDDRPFIVMPYMKNGNARDYVQGHPDCDRLQIFHHVSLGLVYLHKGQIVHGDLKALNVLIDASGRAVLCDFGLSRIKADATSRTTVKNDGGSIVGSHNWMAPEQLRGRSPNKPCDIYAFGMTLYEIFANEIPWGDIDYARLVELVVVRDFRPERPDVEDAPLLSDAVWELAGKCWVKDPKHRLTAMAVCDTISCLLNTVTQTTGQPISSPPHSINLPQPAPQLHTLDQATPTLAHALTPLHSVLHNTSNARHMPDASSSRNVILAGSKPLPPIPIKNMTCRGHTNWVYSAAFSPDGKYIVSGSVDCTIIIWDAQRGDIFLEPHKMHTEGVASVAFSPDNRQIASGSIDTTILVWDSMKGEVVAGPLRGHTDAVWSVSFSSDGKKIASGSWDHTIRIWDVQTGSLLLGPIVGHTDKVNTVTFSGDGKQIVSGSSDKTLSVWDAISGIQIHGHLTAHQNLVRFAAFSPDGKRIVSAWDGNVCAWDTHTGALISGPSKQHPKGTLDVIFMAHSTYYCAVSPDGKWIVGLKDGDRKIIQVWDSMTGLLVDKFSEHTNEVLSVCFSPNSKQILSTSQDTTVQVHTLNL